MARPALVLGATAALALLACWHESVEPPERKVLLPRTRLVEILAGVHADPILVTGREASLSDVWRPVLSSSREFVARTECTSATGRQKSCRPNLPIQLQNTLLLIAEWQLPPQPGEWMGKRVRKLVKRRRTRSKKLTIEVPFVARNSVGLHAVPPLPERDAVTSRVMVPDGARLRFAVGVEEPAWEIGGAAEFTITALHDNGEEVLYNRVLDPAQVLADRGWIEEEIDLAKWAGTKASFRFAVRMVGADTPTLPLWADPTIWAPGSDGGRPYVVLISLDTLRARSLNAYGYALPTMPKFEQWAGRGVLFEQAFTTYSYTLTSHMSMFTGVYPRSHLVYRPVDVLPPRRRQLAQALRTVGYEAAAFTENGLLMSHVGFRRGFSLYYENKEIVAAIGDCAQTFQRALEWARAHRNAPFFLFAHTYQVHSPYDPPEEYRSFFGDPNHLEGAERDRLLYEQEARLLDDELHRFLTGLAELVDSDRLLIIVTSDHGEEFFEHGLPSHEQLYDEVLHIPLVMVWEGVLPAVRRVATPVSLIDIAPTVLDLVGATPLPAVDGLSLKPLWAGSGDGIGRSHVFAEGLPFGRVAGARAALECFRRLGLRHSERRIGCIAAFKHAQDQSPTGRLFAVRGASSKCLVAGPGELRCFNLQADPGEHHPVATDSPSLRELVSELEAYRSTARMGPKRIKRRASDSKPLSDETLRKLRALGYIE